MSGERIRRNGEPATAAEWFVAIDSSAPDDVAAARFTAWLDRAAEHEPELERCAAAVEIARGLAVDPELRWAYDEAAALAARRPRHSWHAIRRFAMLGWVAAASGAAAALLWIALGAGDAVAPRSIATASAASIVASSAGANSTVMLPGRVVVDANSIAVLPFAEAAGDGASRGFAAGLHSDIVAALRAVPGLYVVGGPSVAPYAGTDLSPAEIGAQLGTRGVLAADAALEAGELRVAARLIDAATGDVLWRADYERPIDELRAVQIDVIDNVAAALVDGERRAVSAAAANIQARADSSVATARDRGNIR
jgi:TolB-like protein